MANWKMPPKAKVYEALSAVADDRVAMLTPTRAAVKSSSGEKNYTVEWAEDFSHITSNDNASFWQGYVGYPIIAVLLATGRLSYNRSLVGRLAGVPWKKINDQFKRDYQKAVDSVLDEVSKKGGDRAALVADVDAIYIALRDLNLQRSEQRKRPPIPKQASGQLDLPTS